MLFKNPVDFTLEKKMYEVIKRYDKHHHVI